MNDDAILSKVHSFGKPPGKLDEFAFPDTVITPSRFVIQVAAGDSHVIFLLGNNQIMVCGSNNNGQLGFPKEKVPENLDKPEINLLMIDNNTPLKVTNIACGLNHSLVLGLTPMGKKTLMVFGNSIGLGLGDLQDRYKPEIQNQFEEGFIISGMAACCNRSIVFSNTGKLYIWGGISLIDVGPNKALHIHESRQ